MQLQIKDDLIGTQDGKMCGCRQCTLIVFWKNLPRGQHSDHSERGKSPKNRNNEQNVKKNYLVSADNKVSFL